MTMRHILLFLSLLAPVLFEAVAAEPSPRNQLLNHPSPYLAMHGHDPVHWQVWGPAAQQRAVQEGKLLFVSSGYFSCHWCHVMQRESYSNPAIARLLNEHFIAVKVDRELNPALDARLIDFVERTQGYAGWPLNVFITPQGYPLVGMVYLPPDNFKQVLEKLAMQWQQNRAELAQLAREAGAELQAAETGLATPLPAGIGRQFRQLFVSQALTLADELEGGFGQENKFPSVPQLQFLLQIYRQEPDPKLGDFLRITLDNMAQQGLNDQLGGGFFRYTVDPAWQTPHFEKMLYDNALLAGLYLQAAGVFARSAYEQVARRTLDFVLRELRTPQGGFAASLSAVDDKKVEGGYYLWQDRELEQVLNSRELKVARLIWGLDKPASLEAGHHLVLARTVDEVAQLMKLPVATVSALYASAAGKLLQRRQHRSLPRDDKQIAAWNGLLLSALAEAARLDQGEDYRRAGQGLARFVGSGLWRAGELQRAVSRGHSFGQAGLEDYAYVARGLFDWFAVSGNRSDLELAQRLVREGWQRFYTPEQGWRRIENPWLRYGAGQSVVEDGVLPSPSASLILASLQKPGWQQDKLLADKVLRALNVGHQAIREAPFWYATQILALVRYQDTKISTSSSGGASRISKVNWLNSLVVRNRETSLM
jgi:uncharacterized protein YyaL (SSP411 family)